MQNYSTHKRFRQGVFGGFSGCGTMGIKMSDFEQEFRAKVRGGEEAGPRASSSEKKPIDKRWFVIGGLVLLLIAAVVVLNLWPKGGDVGSMRDRLLGDWSCSGRIQLNMHEDDSYYWRSGSSGIEELGTFSYEKPRLTLQNREGGKRSYEVSGLEQNKFNIDEIVCTRMADE